MSLRKKTKKGFSLIELLVAASIIAILSAIGMAAFRTASQKARDARRKGDLEQIRGAFELYRADMGTYPPGSGAPNYNLACGGSLNGTGAYASNIYMRQIPCDPSGNVPYKYSRTGGNYILGANLEVDPASGNCVFLPGVDYCINNP